MFQSASIPSFRPVRYNGAQVITLACSQPSSTSFSAKISIKSLFLQLLVVCVGRGTTIMHCIFSSFLQYKYIHNENTLHNSQLNSKAIFQSPCLLICTPIPIIRIAIIIRDCVVPENIHTPPPLRKESDFLGGEGGNLPNFPVGTGGSPQGNISKGFS